MLLYIQTMLRRSMRMFLTVARIMVPVMVVVYIADRLGLVAWVGHAIAPAMSLLGLPPEAGIIWATTVITNIYGGIATLSTLSDNIEMNVAQVSALGAMMLFAHNMPTEQSIVRRAGASMLITGGLRIISALLYGALITWLSRATGWMDTPVSFAWLHSSSQATGSADVWTWLESTIVSLAATLVIIIGLVLALDLLERLGITRHITRLLTPVLRISGLEERAAPLTTVGVLLGLAYGGALIIDAAERENYTPRTRLLALSWLSLSHGLIEDTLLILALGANIWIILVGRLLITLLILAAMARLTLPGRRLGRALEG